MKKILDLIWLRIRNYFRHPVENIRQADPIVPGRLYENFGYICKAVRYSLSEQARVLQEAPADGIAIPPEALMEQVKVIGNNQKMIKDLERAHSDSQDVPVRCRLCGFHEKAIPCPYFNRLADGTTVCDTHKYVIIKSPK